MLGVNVLGAVHIEISFVQLRCAGVIAFKVLFILFDFFLKTRKPGRFVGE